MVDSWLVAHSISQQSCPNVTVGGVGTLVTSAGSILASTVLQSNTDPVSYHYFLPNTAFTTMLRLLDIVIFMYNSSRTIAITLPSRNTFEIQFSAPLNSFMQQLFQTLTRFLVRNISWYLLTCCCTRKILSHANKPSQTTTN